MRLKKVLLMLAFTTLISAGVFASSQDIKVTMDGAKLSSDVAPVIVSGRTLVPVRMIFEAIGGKVEWDKHTQTATGTKGSDTIELQIGREKANINGEEFVLDVPATAIKGRTLVPIRFIIESLGCGVYWDSKSRTVVIETSPTDQKHFEFDKAQGRITGYSDIAPKHLVIPNTIDGVAVKHIADSAFTGKNLNSVTIPKGIIGIDGNAFRDNKLTSIVIPKGVKTIGHHAFTSNLLTSVTIPSGVTSIEGYAFSGNKLVSVIIPKGITVINESTFVVNNITSVVIPEGVTSIGYGAFAANKITSLTLPEGVTDIDSSAFSQSPISTITIPKGIENIYKDMFDSNVRFIEQ